MKKTMSPFGYFGILALILALILVIIIFAFSACQSSAPVAAPQEQPAPAAEEKVPEIKQPKVREEPVAKLKAEPFDMIAETVKFDANTMKLEFWVRIPDSFEFEGDRLGYYTLLPAADMYGLPYGLELAKPPIVDEQTAAEENFKDALYRIQLHFKLTGEMLYGEQSIFIKEKAVINGQCDAPKYSNKLEIKFMFPEKPAPAVIQTVVEPPVVSVVQSDTLKTDKSEYYQGSTVKVTFQAYDKRDIKLVRKNMIFASNCGSRANIQNVTYNGNGEYTFELRNAEQVDKSKYCYVDVMVDGKLVRSNPFVFVKRQTGGGDNTDDGDNGSSGGGNNDKKTSFGPDIGYKDEDIKDQNNGTEEANKSDETTGNKPEDMTNITGNNLTQTSSSTNDSNNGSGELVGGVGTPSEGANGNEVVATTV